MILRTVKVGPDVLAQFKNDLVKIKNTISSNEINMQRAKKFRDYTVDMVRMGRLGLKKRTALTTYMMGNYDPLSVTGKMLDKMKVMEAPQGAADAGYFGNDGEVPSIGHRKLTYTDLAILHHTGYRIPLRGEKGERVRKWFYACYGIHFKKNKEFLVVPARPFMLKSIKGYEKLKLDETVVEEFIKQKLGNS